MMGRMAAEPEERPVHTCPGCGALVVDPIKHGSVCLGLTDGETGIGAHIVEWLDSIDVDQLEADSLEAGFDTTATEALMSELRKRAAAL
jgi:hypothetical protein